MATINGRPIAAGQESTTVLQNAAGATGNGTTLPVTPGAVLRLVTVGASTPNAVVTYEWSDDAGATWMAAFLQDLLAAGGIATGRGTVTVTTTKAHALFVVPPGATSFRARISTFVTGTVTVTCVTRAAS